VHTNCFLCQQRQLHLLKQSLLELFAIIFEVLDWFPRFKSIFCLVVLLLLPHLFLPITKNFLKP
jgi:hypothetical protein